MWVLSASTTAGRTFGHLTCNDRAVDELQVDLIRARLDSPAPRDEGDAAARPAIDVSKVSAGEARGESHETNHHARDI
jgi:hypothetical protein